ncbi:uncharacterized protein K452DRAFT_288847 [Aplosporella prunicola CBS 121167]|uniref:Uncharacterized protein n=1 Tax=Aplosporella prunicola CBS 121167 TaxID=1176127 RepID=A0A6A6B9L6_9PEZI|nr:uncharacterized protein K452DRAFT_288847 [Aplosporella prunicola CBS 121167]KAF2140760.1 hypothetical protein K452DRAFT_288847 [Aplosporella prunicola CBS 121167]
MTLIGLKRRRQDSNLRGRSHVISEIVKLLQMSCDTIRVTPINHSGTAPIDGIEIHQHKLSST